MHHGSMARQRRSQKVEVADRTEHQVVAVALSNIHGLCRKLCWIVKHILAAVSSHLGEKRDLKYEAARTREGVQRFARIFLMYLPFHFILIILQLIRGTFKITGGSVLVLSLCLAVFLMNLLSRSKRLDIGDEIALRRATALQISVSVGLHLVITVLSVQIPTTLMQHRMYLGSVIPSLMFYTVVGYVPAHIYNFVFAPTFYVTWIYFHRTVGFLNVASVFYGFVLFGLSCFIRQSLDDSEYKSFKAASELIAEREFLESTQSTLHGLLSSLFDASCICDHTGEVKSHTPQLREMLSGPSQHLQILDLCAFASSDMERRRFLAFLQNVTKNAFRRAETIQVTFNRSPCPLDDLDLPLSSRSFGVTLYAIVLPGRIKETNSNLFIGFQLHTDVDSKAPLGASTTGDCGQRGLRAAIDSTFEYADSEKSFESSSAVSDTSHALPSVRTFFEHIPDIGLIVDSHSEDFSVLELRLSFASTDSSVDSGPKLKDWLPDEKRNVFLAWFQKEMGKQSEELHRSEPVHLEWPQGPSNYPIINAEAEYATIEVLGRADDSKSDLKRHIERVRIQFHGLAHANADCVDTGRHNLRGSRPAGASEKSNSSSGRGKKKFTLGEQVNLMMTIIDTGSRKMLANNSTSNQARNLKQLKSNFKQFVEEILQQTQEQCAVLFKSNVGGHLGMVAETAEEHGTQ